MLPNLKKSLSNFPDPDALEEQITENLEDELESFSTILEALARQTII
jgi:hypothetical protein